jgi:hypothetical protein
MEEKASEKLVGIEREDADLTPMPVVLPSERDGVVGDGDEPVVGNGDAVSVAREARGSFIASSMNRLGE